MAKMTTREILDLLKKKSNSGDEKIVVVDDDDVSLMLGFALGLMAAKGSVPYTLLKVVSDILDEYKQTSDETRPNSQSVQA